MERLGHQASRLIEINNRFVCDNMPRIDFDPDSDLLTFRLGTETIVGKLKRANPDVPIAVVGSRGVGGYRPNSGDDVLPEEALDRRLVFEGLLEDYYNNAHRILKLARTLPGLSNLKCAEITMVRNKLVTHPEGSEVYSFGYGDKGPIVRPLLVENKKWNDQGLLVNTEAFVSALAEGLRTAATVTGEGCGGLTNRCTRPALRFAVRQRVSCTHGADASRRANWASACHLPSVRRFAPVITRLQRSVVHTSLLAPPPAADPQPSSAHNWS